MKFTMLIIASLFLLQTLFVSAGTFLETFFPHSFLKTRHWSHLKLRVDQERFTLSVNGENVLSFTCLFDNLAFLEEDLNVGSIGFGLAGYTARFDNLKITGEGIPNHGGLSIQPEGKLTVTWAALKQTID